MARRGEVRTGEVHAEVARPVALAGERLLPVLPALAPLLPEPGLRRGAVVTVGAASGCGGATSLALALVAGASAAGSWCAAVGAPSLGLAAAAELGIALGRFPLVASPPPGVWATVVAALLDAFDAVLAWPPASLRPAEGRRLVARARERGAVLVLCGERARAVEGVALRLTVVSADWVGLGAGYGHLTGRIVEVVATGRGAASRERRARLWLPAPVGAGPAVAVSREHRAFGTKNVPVPGTFLVPKGEDGAGAAAAAVSPGSAATAAPGRVAG
jgi:hypothetical protein